MKLINCTKHPVRLCDANGVLLSEWAPGVEARVAEKLHGTSQISLDQEHIDSYNDSFIDLHEWGFGDIEGLPEPQKGVMFIVSAMVISALRERGIRRTDLVSPHTGRGMTVTKDGHIWGVKAFRQQI